MKRATVTLDLHSESIGVSGWIDDKQFPGVVVHRGHLVDDWRITHAMSGACVDSGYKRRRDAAQLARILSLVCDFSAVNELDIFPSSPRARTVCRNIAKCIKHGSPMPKRKRATA